MPYIIAIPIAVVAVVSFALSRYRRDIRAARARLDSVASESVHLASKFGSSTQTSERGHVWL